MKGRFMKATFAVIALAAVTAVSHAAGPYRNNAGKSDTYAPQLGFAGEQEKPGTPQVGFAGEQEKPGTQPLGFGCMDSGEQQLGSAGEQEKPGTTQLGF